METVQVKNMILNEGRPKICIPIVGKNDIGIMEELQSLKDVDFDLLELRIDHYEEVEDFSKVVALLQKISKFQKPLLFTFRTSAEGGVREMSEERYFALNGAAIKSGYIDLVDVELFSNEEEIGKLIEEAKKNNVKVVMSNHDFHKTPSKEEIVKRLLRMQELHADISKIAVMPQSEEDVLTLLAATLEMKVSKGNFPCITMSMGSYGVISRLAGELFGSCMTFAAARQISAPGQVSVKDVRKILDVLKLS